MMLFLVLATLGPTLSLYAGNVSDNAWELLWQAEIDGVVRAGPVGDSEGHRVFVGTGQGDYYAIDQSDGEVLWQTPLGSSTYSRAIERNNVLVIGSRGARGTTTLRGVDAADGNLLWANSRFSFIDDPIFAFGDAVIAIGFDAVMSLIPTTGEVLWVFEQSDNDKHYLQNGLVQEGLLYYESWDSGVHLSRVKAWDLETNGLVWERKLPYAGARHITAHNDLLSWAGHARALRGSVVLLANRFTGEILHKYTPAGAVHGLTLTGAGLLIVEGESVSLWSHDLQTRIWEFETRFGAYTKPMVVGNTVLIGGYDEEGLMALDIADGSLKARYPLELREASGYWVSAERDLLIFGEADDNPLKGPRYVRALRVDPDFWD